MKLVRLSSSILLQRSSASCLASARHPSNRSAGAFIAAPRRLHLAHDLLSFHKNLTDIESISGNEKHVGDWLTNSLQSQGYNVEKQYLSHEAERFNVLAWPGRNRDTAVMLTSHIDTVPPFIPYKRENGIISGRGSVDAKGSVATQVLAVNNLLSSGEISPDDVSFLFVVAEEVGGLGMRLANDLKLRPRAVIFGEPTEGKLISGHKGIAVGKIRTKGRAAHSGYPWLGLSATEILVAALERLRHLGDHLPQSDKYGKTTLNLGLLKGGAALNIVPESASADIVVRIAAGSPAEIQSAITTTVHEAVAPFLTNDMKPSDVVELDFPFAGHGPIDLSVDVPGFDTTTVNYGSDIPWLDKTVENQRRYLYGPGSIFVAHTDHEALSEDDLFGAVEDYKRIVVHALQKVKEEM